MVFEPARRRPPLRHRRRRQRVPRGRGCVVYERRDRFVISWDINTDWELETDLERTSEVEVRLRAEGAERTRVELDAPSASIATATAGQDRMRDAVGSPTTAGLPGLRALRGHRSEVADSRAVAISSSRPGRRHGGSSTARAGSASRSGLSGCRAGGSRREAVDVVEQADEAAPDGGGEHGARARRRRRAPGREGRAPQHPRSGAAGESVIVPPSCSSGRLTLRIR